MPNELTNLAPSGHPQVAALRAKARAAAIPLPPGFVPFVP